jgi:hypothetical protein
MHTSTLRCTNDTEPPARLLKEGDDPSFSQHSIHEHVHTSSSVADAFRIFVYSSLTLKPVSEGLKVIVVDLPESSKIAQSQLTSVRQHVFPDDFDQGVHHGLQVLLFEAGGSLELGEQVTLANHLENNEGKLRKDRCMKRKPCAYLWLGLVNSGHLEGRHPVSRFERGRNKGECLLRNQQHTNE